MIIAYYSLTGNVRRFVHRLGMPGSLLEIKSGGQAVNEPFVLVTPTVGFGQTPGTVADFADNNRVWLRGVAASGNTNWGGNYAAAGRKLAVAYKVPLLLTFELSGLDEDVTKFKTEVLRLSSHISN